MKSRSHCLRLALSAAALQLPIVAQAWSLQESALVHPAYAGATPAKSDVVFSTRFRRDKAVPVAASFGATRIEWVHVWDADFIGQLKSVSPWFGGSINANGPLPSDAGMARDFDGQVLVPPGLRAVGAKWITTTHPDTQLVLADQVTRYLEAGASSIQVDDALLQYHGALRYGGDFNPSTLAGFKKFVANYPNQSLVRRLGLDTFDGTYRDYLRAKHAVKDAPDYKRRFRSFPSTVLWLNYIQSSVEENYARLRRQADSKIGKHVPFSMNMYTLIEPTEKNPYFNLVPYADYSMPETDIKDFTALISMSTTVRALGLGWVPSIRPLGVTENRAAIASIYAMGGQALVPWDVYTASDPSGKPAPRYFGTVEEYGDLYRFVRANSDLFDGYEADPVVGVVVRVDRYPETDARALVQTLVERQIPFAFVPVGGLDRRYSIDPERAKHFKMLVTVNPEADFEAQDLKAIAQSRVPRRRAADLRGSDLDDLRPFVVAPGGQTLRLFPRSVPGIEGRLVIHVVDEARAAPGSAEGDCRRRIGIKKEMLEANAVKAANWVTGTTRTRLKVDAMPTGTFFSIEGCPLWGVLDLELRR